MPFQRSILLVYSLGLTGIFRLPSVAAGECTASSLRDCLGAFTIGQFDVYHLDDDIPTWNDSLYRVKQRCQAYTVFASCLEPVTSSCNSSLQLALEGLGNAYQYLCTGTGIADFASNQSCYVKQDVREMAKICNQSYSAKLSTVAYSDNALSLYCRYVDDYIDCLTSGITMRCDSKAAKWQYDWIRNLRQPEMQINKCPGWVVEESSSNVWATALLVALALITILMIVGIITLVVFIIRKRMFRERLRRSLDGSSAGPDGDSTPLPPPYSIVVETPGPDGQLQPHLVDSLSGEGDNSSSSNRRDVRQGRTASTSVPFKVPILPPPYHERPEESAPPYYEFLPVETSSGPGQANEGFVGEEGGEKSTEEDLQVVRAETGNNKAEISEA